ncbi:MAG: hypothetical protein ACE366_24400 [Bradymonadia bacterium]
MSDKTPAAPAPAPAPAQAPAPAPAPAPALQMQSQSGQSAELMGGFQGGFSAPPPPDSTNSQSNEMRSIQFQEDAGTANMEAQVTQDIEKIRGAIEGWGTDEQGIYRILNQPPEIVQAIADGYERKYGTRLVDDIIGDMSGSELRTAQALLTRAGVSSGAGGSYQQDTSETIADRHAHIRAEPDVKVAVPGTALSYRIERNAEMYAQGSYYSYEWSVVRDASMSSKHDTDAMEILGDDYKVEYTPEIPGNHKIVCRSVFYSSSERQRREPEYFEYPLTVIAEGEMASGALENAATTDPTARLEGQRRYVDAIKSASEQEGSRALTPEQQQAYDNQIEKFEERMASTNGRERIPFKAVHVDREQARVTTLQAFVACVQSGSRQTWKLVDVTAPADRRCTGEYTGTGSDAASAIDDAISSWRSGNRYPPGMIQLEIPAEAAGTPIAQEFQTDGQSFWDSISEFFDTVGLATGLGALALAVLPIPGSRVVAGLVLASAVAASAGAAIRISQRHAEGFSSPQDDALDALTIVSSVFAGVWVKGATVIMNGRNGTNIARGVLIGQFSADAGQGIILADKYLADYERIMKNPDPQQRTDELLRLLQSAALTGALISISLKGSGDDLARVGAARNSTGALNSPGTTLNLDDLPANTAGGDVTPATSGVDDGLSTAGGDIAAPGAQNADALAAAGDIETGSVRSANKTTPDGAPKETGPTGPQRAADLDELYEQARVAQEELATVTNDIAGATGGEAKIPPNLKGRPRAEEKLAADYGGDVSRLTDLARTSIIYESLDDVYRGLEQIQGRFEVTKLKDRFANPTDQGYRDILLNVRMSNGHVVEIQLHMKQIIEVKSGAGHSLYEEIRTIEARAKAENRALTPEELGRIEQLNAQSRSVYDEAMSGGTSGPKSTEGADVEAQPGGPQRAADLDELYEQARVAQEELATVTNDIAGSTGGEAKIPPNLKGRPRAEEKLAADYGGDVSRLTDLARTSIIYESLDDVYRGLEQIQGRFEVTKLKDRFANPTDQGYRDILLNVRMSNGHVVEIQLHMKQIIEVKSGAGHKLYEEIRTIEATAKAENRALTPEELGRIEQLNAQSRSVYDEALSGGTSAPKSSDGADVEAQPGGPQRAADLDELYQQAAVAQEELATVTNDIAGATGGEAKIPPNLKGRPRAEEKLAADYGGDVSRLTDLARTSIIYESLDDVYRGLEQIQGRFEVTKLKDRFANPTDQGYRDILLNVRMSNGHVVEIQLHMKQIIEVKSGAGHKLYEDIRTIEAKAKAENRPLTPEELARIEDLNAQSRAVYDDAMSGGTSGTKSAEGADAEAQPGGPQRATDLDELYEQAAVAQEELATVTNDIAGATGGEAKIPPNLKGRPRAEEKLAADYGGDVSRLTDLARTSIIYEP